MGTGSPGPGRLVSLRPKRRFPPDTTMLLSRLCMTSAMTVRSDQPRTERLRAKAAGLRAMTPSAASQRGSRPPPSTSTVCSRPMALLPLP